MAWTRREIYGLGFAVGVYFLMHAVAVPEGFGEPDAARLANDAAIWHATGVLQPALVYYRVLTSPLYLRVLKGLLDAGLSLQHMPAVMNWVNVVVGALVLMPIYRFSRLLTSPMVAAASCLLYAFTPGFWMASTYGFPHLLSWGMLIISLLVFLRTVQMRGRTYLSGAMLTIGCLAVAYSLKADTMLCSGALFGLLVCRGQMNVRQGLLASLIIVFSVIVSFRYSYFLAPSLSLRHMVSAWDQQFPLQTNPLNNLSLAMMVSTIGPVLFLASAVVWTYSMWVNPQERRLAWLVLFWGLPSLLFWGVRPPNSIRHNMPAMLPAVLLVAATVCSQIRNRRHGVAVLVMMLVANCACGDPARIPYPYGLDGFTMFEWSANLRRHVHLVHQTGKAFAALKEEKKMFVGDGYNPYVLFELLTTLKRFQWIELGHEMQVETLHGQHQRIRWEYTVSPTEAETAAKTGQEHGWVVWSLPSDLSRAPWHLI